ncbi:MAG: DUF502 domain-containing protein [Candidatus Rokuibacteriota bacterium]
MLLPLALTAAVLAWVAGLVNRLVGPSSIVGRIFAALGYPFSSNPGLAYVFGTLILIAAVYFVGLLERKQEADIGAMSPVWCFFGGNGVAVLAPSAQPVEIDGRSYRAVLIPTAPVPFGGALLYVPVDWVRPANIGVETLTAIYVSMGITPPPTPSEAPVRSR